MEPLVSSSVAPSVDRDWPCSEACNMMASAADVLITQLDIEGTRYQHTNLRALKLGSKILSLSSSSASTPSIAPDFSSSSSSSSSASCSRTICSSEHPDISRLILSPLSGQHLLRISSSSCSVVRIPKIPTGSSSRPSSAVASSSSSSLLSCASVKLDNSSTGVNDADFHPLSESHVIVLTSDQRLCTYNIKAPNEPEQEIELDSLEPKNDRGLWTCIAVDRTCSQGAWGPSSVLIASQNGAIALVTPIIPYECVMSSRIREEMEVSASNNDSNREDQSTFLNEIFSQTPLSSSSSHLRRSSVSEHSHSNPNLTHRPSSSRFSVPNVSFVYSAHSSSATVADLKMLNCSVPSAILLFHDLTAHVLISPKPFTPSWNGSTSYALSLIQSIDLSATFIPRSLDPSPLAKSLPNAPYLSPDSTRRDIVHIVAPLNGISSILLPMIPQIETDLLSHSSPSSDALLPAHHFLASSVVAAAGCSSSITGFASTGAAGPSVGSLLLELHSDGKLVSFRLEKLVSTFLAAQSTPASSSRGLSSTPAAFSSSSSSQKRLDDLYESVKSRMEKLKMAKVELPKDKISESRMNKSDVEKMAIAQKAFVDFSERQAVALKGFRELEAMCAQRMNELAQQQVKQEQENDFLHDELVGTKQELEQLMSERMNGCKAETIQMLRRASSVYEKAMYVAEMKTMNPHDRLIAQKARRLHDTGLNVIKKEIAQLEKQVEGYVGQLNQDAVQRSRVHQVSPTLTEEQKSVIAAVIKESSKELNEMKKTLRAIQLQQKAEIE